jgi:hypothetical protein
MIQTKAPHLLTCGRQRYAITLRGQLQKLKKKNTFFWVFENSNAYPASLERTPVGC